MINNSILLQIIIRFLLQNVRRMCFFFLFRFWLDDGGKEGRGKRRGGKFYQVVADVHTESLTVISGRDREMDVRKRGTKYREPDNSTRFASGSSMCVLDCVLRRHLPSPFHMILQPPRARSIRPPRGGAARYAVSGDFNGPLQSYRSLNERKEAV